MTATWKKGETERKREKELLIALSLIIGNQLPFISYMSSLNWERFRAEVNFDTNFCFLIFPVYTYTLFVSVCN